MFKQVPCFSSKRFQTVSRVYPTAGHLLAAYDQKANRQALVADLVHEAHATSRDVKVGPPSAAELHIAYGLANDDEQLRGSIQVLPSQSSTGADYAALERRAEETKQLSQHSGQKISCKRVPRTVSLAQETYVSAVGLCSYKEDVHGSGSDKEQINSSGGRRKQSTSFGDCVELTTAMSPTTKTSLHVTKGFSDIPWETSIEITPASMHCFAVVCSTNSILFAEVPPGGCPSRSIGTQTKRP